MTDTSIAALPADGEPDVRRPPAGLHCHFNSTAATAPYARTVIVGSTNTIAAPRRRQGTSTMCSPRGRTAGRSRTSSPAPANAATYTATFTPAATPTGPGRRLRVRGTTGAMSDGQFRQQPQRDVTGATGTTAGRVRQRPVVRRDQRLGDRGRPESLDLTTGMTLEAWVGRPRPALTGDDRPEGAGDKRPGVRAVRGRRQRPTAGRVHQPDGSDPQVAGPRACR